MQSIIRSSIKNKNIFLKNRGQFSITRNYCNDHNGSNNNDHSTISFEKFKENRELMKKKAELIKEITQSRLLGESDKILKLQQQISSIEKILDPKIEQFSVQSKEQKEAELEIWKRFLEKKGITTRSQLRSVSKYEFERFKATGLLDVESEKIRKDKEKENELKSINPKTGEKIPTRKITNAQRINADPIIRDAFPSPFVGNPNVESKEFEIVEQQEEEEEQENGVPKTKKEKMSALIAKMEEQSNKDPQFKLMVMNFLDDSIPLKDKLIFRDDFEISPETLKTFKFINNDVDSKESITEEERKAIKDAQQKLLDLQIKEIIKDYEINSKLEEKRLNILTRNNAILRHKINEIGAINEDGTVDMQRILNEPFAVENLTMYALEPNRTNFAGNYIYKNGEEMMLEEAHVIPYEILFEEDVESQKKLNKLKSTDNLTAFVNEDFSAKDIKEFLSEFTPTEMDVFKRIQSLLGKSIVEIALAPPSRNKINARLEREKANELLQLSDTFEDHVLLAPDEVEEFPSDDLLVPEDRVPITKEDTPVVKAFKERVVEEGRLQDLQTKINHINNQPEYESLQLMKDLKIKQYEEEKQLEKDLLETNDPMMIRNFIKYKYDQQKELINQKNEEDYKNHMSTLREVQQEVSQGSLSLLDSQPIYHPVTGKLYTPKKKNPKCLLCQNPNWQVDPINAPFLSLYLNQSGDILPRHYSGNCLKHQKKIARTIKQAKALGIFSYKKGTFTIHDPNLYNLSKSELEEYNKWYDGTYTQEELQQVYDEYHAIKLLETSQNKLTQEQSETSKQGQQEQLLLEFGMETNDLIKMYGKDRQQ
ncbi:hypothetical protein ACTFIV_000477 [Dictyostelium citrinum]